MQQVVHPRYLEAIRLGQAALSEPGPSSTAAPFPLPYLFGSPEYLQVYAHPFQQLSSAFHQRTIGMR